MDTTFRGNLGNLGLAEILQTLASGGKEGSLVIETQVAKTELYVSQGSITLADADFDGRAALVHQCVALGLVPPEAASGLLDARQRSGRSVTDLLRREAGVPNDDIEQLRRLWYQDRILTLFVNRNGLFSFRDEPAIGRRIASASLPTYPIDAVVMEAARQQDEWALLSSTIPHDRVVLESAGARPALDPDADATFTHVESLLDGKTPLGLAVERSYLTRFDFFKTAAGFVQAGALRLVPPATLVDRARQLAASNDAEIRRAGLALFESYLLDSPKDDAATLDKARLLWQLGRRGEAAELFGPLVPWLIRQKRVPEAFDLVLQTTEALPDLTEMEDRFALFFPGSLDALGEKKGVALERGLALVERWIRERRNEEALELLEHVLDQDPSNEGARHRAINIAIDLGRSDRAAEHYEQMAAHCVATGEWKKLVDIYQRVLRLEPRRTGVVKKLQQAQERLNSQSPDYRRRVLKIRAAVAATILVVGAIAWHQHRTWNEFDELGVEDLVRERRYDEAIERLETFRGDHSFSLATFRATSRQAEIRDEWTAFRAERTKQMEPERTKALELARQGDFAGAVALVRRILDGPLSEDFRIETSESLEAIEKTSAEFAELKSSVDAARKDGRFHEAYYLTRQLLDAYGDRPLAIADLRLPVEVTTVPPAASITLGSGGAPMGRIVEVAPHATVPIRIAHPGYGPVEVAVGDDRPRIDVFLPKAPIWTRRSELRLEHGPACDGTRAYFAAEGAIVAFEPTADELVESWRTRIASPATCAPTPIPDTQDVLVTTASGQLLRVGRAGQAWGVATGASSPGRPMALPGTALAAVVLDEKRLGVFRLADGAREWTWPDRGGGSGKIVGQPAAIGGRVLLATSDQKLALVDPVAHTVVWETSIASAPVAGPAPVGDEILLPTADRPVRRFTLDGTELPEEAAWLTEDPAYGPFVGDGRVVYVSAAGEVLEAGPGKRAGRVPGGPPKLPTAPALAPVLDGSVLLYADAEGAVSAVRAEPNRDRRRLVTLWTWREEGSQVLGLARCGDRVLVATRDGRVIALEP